MLRCASLLLIAPCVVFAHDPVTTSLTWSQEISRIVYKRCLSCHRADGAAMPLGTYEEARPWAKAIRDEVLARRMPPWGAVKGYGDFQDDASLTQEEITRLAEWVEGGAPPGNPAYLPPGQPAAAKTTPPPAAQVLRGSLVRSVVNVIGIRPTGDVAESKIYALLPGGAVEPLIWLRNYKQTRTFLYRQPLELPAGTRLAADPPVSFELLVQPAKAGSRAH